MESQHLDREASLSELLASGVQWDGMVKLPRQSPRPTEPYKTQLCEPLLPPSVCIHSSRTDHTESVAFGAFASPNQKSGEHDSLGSGSKLSAQDYLSKRPIAG